MINQRGGRVPPVHLLVRLRGSPLTIQDESAVPRAAGRGSAARLRDPRRAEPRVLRPCFASLVRPVQMPETLGIRAGSVPSQLLRVDPRDFLHPQLLDDLQLSATAHGSAPVPAARHMFGLHGLLSIIDSNWLLAREHF